MHLAGLVVGDEPSAWKAAGFTVSPATGPGLGDVDVGGVRIRLSGQDGGVQRWELADPGNSGPADIDGLSTAWRRAGDVAPTVEHPNGATALDHVVVATPHRDRTIAAFEADLGLQVRRQTEHELSRRRMVQTFFLLRPTVIEVLSPREPEGDGPAAFWGLAFTVDDLDAAKDRLGDLLSDPREAVQPGRRIATVRRDEIGLSVPVALLSPRVR